MHTSFLTPAGFGVFLLFWMGLLVLGFGGFLLGVIALIDVAQSPVERFGPWWDNGRRGLRSYGVAGRPFWSGPPKPPPLWGPTPPGWSGPPGPPPPGWGPPPPSGG